MTDHTPTSRARYSYMHNQFSAASITGALAQGDKQGWVPS